MMAPAFSSKGEDGSSRLAASLFCEADCGPRSFKKSRLSRARLRSRSWVSKTVEAAQALGKIGEALGLRQRFGLFRRRSRRLHARKPHARIGEHRLQGRFLAKRPPPFQLLPVAFPGKLSRLVLGFWRRDGLLGKRRHGRSRRLFFSRNEARVGRILQENGRSLGLLLLLGLAGSLGEPCIIAVSHGGKEHGQKHARNQKGHAVQTPDMGRRGQFVRGVFGRLAHGNASRKERPEARTMAPPASRARSEAAVPPSIVTVSKRARLERHDSKADPVCGARIVLDPIALGLKDADEFFPDGLPGLVRWALEAKDLLAGRQAKADDARDGVGGGSHILRRHRHGRWKRGEGRAGCEQQRDGKRD